jgi:hypothetical protein
LAPDALSNANDVIVSSQANQAGVSGAIRDVSGVSPECTA